MRDSVLKCYVIRELYPTSAKPYWLRVMPVYDIKCLPRKFKDYPFAEKLKKQKCSFLNQMSMLRLKHGSTILGEINYVDIDQQIFERRDN